MAVPNQRMKSGTAIIASELEITDYNRLNRGRT